MQPKTATALQALSMAQNLLDSGLSAEMISFLKTHIDDYKENISYLLRAGQLAMNAENFDLALEHFRAIPSGAPSTVTTLVSQWKALCLYCADFASTDAILLFEKYHFLDDTGYLSKLAFHFESNWLHDKLYFSGRDISLSKDWQAKSSKKLGHYIEHGQWQSVYDCLSQQTAINDETHFYLAGTCEMLGDYTSCCKHLDLISPEIQEQHSVKACRGRALIRQRQFSEGVRINKLNKK